MVVTEDPFAVAAASAARLTDLAGPQDVAVVLGSGWVPAIDALGTLVAEVTVTDLPGFLPPAVQGHAGRIRSLDVAGIRVLAFLGRTHLYEGRGVEPVVHGVRVAASGGLPDVVLTNACGGCARGSRSASPS